MSIEPNYLEDQILTHEEDEGDANWIMSYADMMTLLMAFFAIMFSFSQIDQHKFDEMRQGLSQQFGGKMQMAFSDVDKALEEIIKSGNMEKVVRVDQDGSGLTIVFQGASFFDAGSAQIRTEAKNVLDRILDVIQKSAKGYPVHVEGHTDDMPIKSEVFPSNWELSAGRASLVVRMLESRSFPKELLTAQGFADSRPILPNRDAQGVGIPENQAQNRRVLIRISRETTLKTI